MSTGQIETPSGKDEAYENFPVGSWLLPAHLRPHIATFYAFARAIDDIADNPDLDPDEKVGRLENYARAVKGEVPGMAGYGKGDAMHATLTLTGVTPQHCLDLIDAFIQDARQNRYETWDDLIDYCMRSAAPVGRYLLDLHGGSRAGYAASDALCNALQVINHLQDCADDYREMNRVYLPQSWMREHGAAVSDLGHDTCSPALRAVIDQCLEGIRDLLVDAQPLPGGLYSMRLAMESQAIIEIAERLVVLLGMCDPLFTKVKLTKPGYAWCILKGVVKAPFLK